MFHSGQCDDVAWSLALTGILCPETSPQGAGMLQNTFTWPTSVSTEIWTWNIAMLPGIFSNHIQVKTPLSHIYRRECQFQDRCLLRIEHTFDYTPRRHPVAVWLLHNYEEGEVRVTHHMGAIGFWTSSDQQEKQFLRKYAFKHLSSGRPTE